MKRVRHASKIVTVIGARPQFIKAAPVSRAIQASNQGSSPGGDAVRINEVIVHTGQHYDDNMSEVFFRELELPQPAYHLQVGSGSHGEQTGEMLKRLESVLLKEKPDYVMVYGDTNSTLAGALAAAKLHIPVAHVEAGLRSFNQHMPEEINRVLTDHISTLLFCPTDTAIKNLRREGFTTILPVTSGSRPVRITSADRLVANVGDVMHDALRYNVHLAERRSNILERLGLMEASRKPSPYYLATVHRAENTDNPDRLEAIVKAFVRLNKQHPVVWPTHPRTLKVIEASLGSRTLCSSLRLIEPASYLDMLVLERNARTILTDSGGVQKEAYWLGVPCVTLRDETEWLETVKSGWNVLAGAETQSIVLKAERMQRTRSQLAEVKIPGAAAERLVRLLQAALLRVRTTRDEE
jgi:UDP-GlcNAc3NAcA epimerase